MASRPLLNFCTDSSWDPIESMSTETIVKPAGPDPGIHSPSDPLFIEPPVKADYVIVGSGLTGGTIARMLTDAGREVVVLERRPHVGGNVHDHRHPSGVRIHTYGPHYFRTGS